MCLYKPTAVLDPAVATAQFLVIISAIHTLDPELAVVSKEAAALEDIVIQDMADLAGVA
jgi:hypothetical protein